MIRRLGDKLRALLDSDALNGIEADLQALTEAEGLAMRAGPRPRLEDGLLALLRQAGASPRCAPASPPTMERRRRRRAAGRAAPPHRHRKRDSLTAPLGSHRNNTAGLPVDQIVVFPFTKLCAPTITMRPPGDLITVDETSWILFPITRLILRAKASLLTIR